MEEKELQVPKFADVMTVEERAIYDDTSKSLDDIVAHMKYTDKSMVMMRPRPDLGVFVISSNKVAVEMLLDAINTVIAAMVAAGENDNNGTSI